LIVRTSGLPLFLRRSSLTRLNADPSWNNIKPDGRLRTYDRKRANGGHAVSIVGYTAVRFIIRNSWGAGWGHKGFAYASYEYATDAFHEAYGIVI
jgi:C1A family cysteine protease